MPHLRPFDESGEAGRRSEVLESLQKSVLAQQEYCTCQYCRQFFRIDSLQSPVCPNTACRIEWEAVAVKLDQSSSVPEVFAHLPVINESLLKKSVSYHKNRGQLGRRSVMTARVTGDYL